MKFGAELRFEFSNQVIAC